MPQCLLASVALCALLTVTPALSAQDKIAGALEGSGDAQIFYGVRAPAQGAPEDARFDPVVSGPEGQSAHTEQEPRSDGLSARRSISKLVGSLGAAFESAIGAASDANLESENSEQQPPRRLTLETTCAIMGEAAAENDLPEALFVRLIWQESRFRHDAVSPVGAQGIAQFMPATAAERGLENPFDPVQALPASAEFLRDLVTQFGNFGLAAAAYNGGPGRVGRWLAGKGGLPQETRNYVIQITGRTAEHWAKFAAAEPHPEAIKVSDCKVPPLRAALAEARNEERKRTQKRVGTRVAARDAKDVKDTKMAAVPTPAKLAEAWIAAIAGNWSEKRARAVFADLQKKHPKVLGAHSPTVRQKRMAGKKAPKTIVGVVADTRAEAQKLCNQLRQAGSACIVQKDPA